MFDVTRIQCGLPQDGYTALMLAAKGGFSDIVQILMDHGAHVNLRRIKVSTFARVISSPLRSYGCKYVFVSLFPCIHDEGLPICAIDVLYSLLCDLQGIVLCYLLLLRYTG